MLAGIAISSSGQAERFQFVFGKGAFRDEEIFDSANSPPSRYIVEMGRRILENRPDAETLVIGNPLLPLDPAQVADWTVGMCGGPAIVTDEKKFPLAYVLPRRLFGASERFLLLLSTVNADIDLHLLRAFCDQKVACHRRTDIAISDFPLSTPTGWFQGQERQKTLLIQGMGAVNVIERNPGWHSLPFATYQPYHAGSLLFLNLASRQVADSFFDRQILCWSYKDIVQACPGRQQPLWLRLPWLPRDNSVGEVEYFVRSLERLGPDVVDNHFIVFTRYSRVYDATPFHLIDQLKFALGDSMRDAAKTVHGHPPVKSGRPVLPARPLRLLFHLTGGWKLKSYRDDHAAVVFMALKSLGCEITVIDRPDQEKFGVTSIVSDDTDLLTATVQRHHIFIGVDSFPHHFVRHVLGWPTIGVFANTKPCNSDAKEEKDYRALVGHLPCNPCGSNEQCPILGHQQCANFVEPARLVSAILGMAHDLYDFPL